MKLKICNLRNLGLIFISSLFTIIVCGQEQKSILIQLTGMVVESDSLKPIQFVHIILKKKRRGTISNFSGFFSIVAEPEDTVIFSSVGYKKTYFAIPSLDDTTGYLLKNDQLTIIQTMSKDTILLPEAIIYPWLNKMHFQSMFLTTIIPKDDLDRAKANLALILADLSYDRLQMDGVENQKYYIRQESGKWTYKGQYPSNPLLNPFLMAEFIDALFRGKLRNPNKDKYK